MMQQRYTVRTVGFACRFLFPVLFLFALSGCYDRPSEPSPENARLITAERIAAGGTASGTNRSESEKETFEEEGAGAKIPLEPGQHVLQVLNANLDIDQDEEQLIVYKKRNDPEDLIHLTVVEFDTVRNGYVATWQGSTRAASVRTFAVMLMDMVGDHQIEIVCTGMNGTGEQTIDVFRRIPYVSGGLQFRSIAAMTSDGTIEILESERSGAYELGQAYGVSYPIVTYTSDPSSSNIMDLVRTTYYWKYQDNRYIKGKVEKVPGRKAEERQLQELYEKGEGTFEALLSGPWYMESTEDGTGGSGREVILFEPGERKITFYNGEVQEVYDWLGSHKTLYNGLYINSENESIPSIKKHMSIRALSLDMITLGVAGNDQWEGTYRKLTRELQQSMLTDRNGIRDVALAPLSLSGLYRNTSGFEIYFSEPHFTMQADGKKSAGGYTLYTLGETVLELKIMRESGLVADTRSYQVEYGEEADAAKITRILILTPIRIGVHGPEPFLGDAIRLEQIEIREKEEDGNDTPAGAEG